MDTPSPNPPPSAIPERIDDLYFDLVQAREESELHLRETERLLDGLPLLNEALSPGDIYVGILNMARRVFEFEEAFILIPAENDEAHLKAIASTSPLFRESHWPIRDRFRAVLNGKPLAVYDTRQIEEWKSQPEEFCRTAVAALHVPLLAQGLTAILVCTSRQRGFFTSRHYHLAPRFSVLAVQALRNASLYGDIQTERDAVRQIARKEAFIADISSRFINLTTEETDPAIQEALKAIGELTHVDRCYVFLIDESRDTMSNSHEWCATGIAPAIETLQQIPCSLLPWWMDVLKQFGTIHVPRVSEMPPEASAEMEILIQQGIQSLVVVPIVWRQTLRGFLGFDSVRSVRTWTSEDQRVLEMLANTFAHALERVRTEKQRQQMEIQLRHGQKMESIGQLAAGIAHELNNPIGFIQNNFNALKENMDVVMELLADYRELAQDAAACPDLADKAARIARKAEDYKMEFILGDLASLFADTRDGFKRTSAIINSMRDFSRTDQVSEKAPYNINTGIQNTLIIAKNEYKYHAEIKTELGELAEILCNAGQINQVFLNMIVNAAHAIAGENRTEKGLIFIKTYFYGGNIFCEIADDGPGIPDEIQGRVFDPFFTTKEPGKGTGLGLSISYDIIVQKHRGGIQLVSPNHLEGTKGTGATFIIRLPVT